MLNQRRRYVKLHLNHDLTFFAVFWVLSMLVRDHKVMVSLETVLRIEGVYLISCFSKIILFKTNCNFPTTSLFHDFRISDFYEQKNWSTYNFTSYTIKGITFFMVKLFIYGGFNVASKPTINNFCLVTNAVCGLALSQWYATPLRLKILIIILSLQN